MQDQKLPRTAKFTFDEYSLAAVANSLHTLNLSGNRVSACAPLYYCDRIEFLYLSNNQITEFEDLVPLLQTMRTLRHLDMRDNPVTKLTKYWERVIMEGKMLQELDGKTVRQ